MTWFNSLPSFLSATAPLPQKDYIPTRDPRWDLVCHGVCPCCDTPILDLLSFAYTSPTHWAGSMEAFGNSFFATSLSDILCDDFCRIAQDTYIRAILCLPLEGGESPLIIGVWVHLDGEYLERYHASFGSTTQASIGPLYGTLANDIGGNAYPLPVILHPQNDCQRPLVQIAFEDHPLYVAQLDGLTIDQFTTLLEGYGHHLPEAMQIQSD